MQSMAGGPTARPRCRGPERRTASCRGRYGTRGHRGDRNCGDRGQLRCRAGWRPPVGSSVARRAGSGLTVVLNRRVRGRRVGLEPTPPSRRTAGRLLDLAPATPSVRPFLRRRGEVVEALRTAARLLRACGSTDQAPDPECEGQRQQDPGQEQPHPPLHRVRSMASRKPTSSLSATSKLRSVRKLAPPRRASGPHGRGRPRPSEHGAARDSMRTRSHDARAVIADRACATDATSNGTGCRALQGAV